MTTSRVVIGVAVLAAAVPQIASADARDAGAADELFKKGLAALDKNDWPTGCADFTASMKLEPSVGTQINVARCAAHDGLLARARAEFEKARTLNIDTPGQRKKDVDKFISEQLARIEPRLPWITIDVSESPPGLVLTRDQAPFPVEALHQEVPIDPGHHVVTASAPGFQDVKRDVEMKEGAHEVVRLVLTRQVNAPALPVAKDAPPRDLSAPQSSAPSSRGARPLLVSGATLTALGGASLIASIATGALALSDRSQIDKLISSKTCAESGGTLTCTTALARTAATNADNAGKPMALASTVTLFAGAAVATAGLVMLVVGATTKESRRRGDASIGIVPLRDGAALLAGAPF